MSRACNSAPHKVAPLSTNSSLTSRATSSRINSVKSTRPPSPGRRSTSTFALRSCWRRPPSSAAVATSTGPVPASILACGEIRKRLSTTTRSGWRASVISRTSSRGSSLCTVSMPTMIAELRARHLCTSARAAAPVIHLLSPLAMAVRPSRLAASLARTNGRPRRMRLMNPGLSASAWCCNRPTSTPMPAALSAAIPLPPTFGLGSSMATTARPIRAWIRASLQGGVRPWCEHGSSVMKAVAPCARAPAVCSAWISAWGSPARSCHPSPTIRSAWTSRHPTRGFGSAL